MEATIEKQCGKPEDSSVTDMGAVGEGKGSLNSGKGTKVNFTKEI